ncbi:MAG TPA: ImmA/IrrE family metallo-endopeptidase [Burkholderiales bacterium]|nr:ImmA/IrrE family metallo-endopeptidase [Burkholderiales bacterium]
MRPRAAANQLTRVLRAALPPERWFPVDPLAIAAELKIQVYQEDLGAGMEGAMLCAGAKSAIVVSTRIREPGRRNFTAAHELGHYSLHKDREELRCSIENLLDVAPHPTNIEQEANEFAMTLLMPADDVRERSHGKNTSISLVKELAARYGTSLTATALRIREVSDRAIALIFVQSGLIKWCWPTDRFPWRPAKGTPWPGGIDLSDSQKPYASEAHFGTEAMLALGERLLVSGADMPSYGASLWILESIDPRRKWERDADESLQEA